MSTSKIFPASPIYGRLLEGGRLMSPDGRVWHEPRAAPLRAVRPNHARARTPRALAPPRRAHCPCTARISALGRIHGRTVWGGCTGGGLACGSLTIHTHHAMGRESVAQFRVIRETLHPPRQVSRHFVAWLAHDQIRVGDRVFWPGLLPGSSWNTST